MTSATRKITPNPVYAAGGEQGVEQIVRECIRRIEKREEEVRAFVHFDPEGALAQARALDALAPAQRGPLHGMPVAIKEVYDVKGLKCAWGTPIHANRVPGNDAWAVAALREAGAVIMGTAVSTEYALATVGPTRNPWDSSRTPGASSSGPAAAVGAGMVPVAIGSQTIGSIIRPAAYCGVFGFKPSWGCIDGTGAMPLSEPLDHVGILAAEMKDLHAVFSVLRQGPDIGDRAEADMPHRLKVHVITEIGNEPLTPAALSAIERAADVFASLGREVIRTALPRELAADDGLLKIILCRDMARHHGRDRDRSGDRMSERVRSMIDRGRAISDAEYTKAREQADGFASRLEDILGPGGLFLTAATTGVAPLSAHGTGSRGPQWLWTLTGMPAVTVPCGNVDGLPIGVQLVAIRNNDAAVLSAAGQLSESLA